MVRAFPTDHCGQPPGSMSIACVADWGICRYTGRYRILRFSMTTTITLDTPAAPGTEKKIDFPKVTTIAVMHMAQYFPEAFAGIALPAIFRREGLPLEMFWLLALPLIPRWLKWLLAMVDAFGWTTTMVTASVPASQ